jgi:hypothetical protein
LSTVVGTANPCNIYWRVGSSATLNGVNFRGTCHREHQHHGGLWRQFGWPSPRGNRCKRRGDDGRTIAAVGVAS